MKKNTKYWWCFGILPVLAIGCFVMSKNFDSVDWQLVDRDISMKVLAENSSNIIGLRDSTEIQSNITSMHFTPKDSPSLDIYNFNTNKLCGIGGCLYSIYSGNILLSRVLLDKAVSVSTEENCLALSQKGEKNTAVLRYCYLGTKYVQQSIIYR
jgi:hypothetical protein